MVYTFYLRDLYTTTEVQEPRGWKDLMSVLDRDFETHGVFFKYTEGALKLGFACEGKTLLEDAYLAKGTEAFYEFLVDEDGVNIFTSQLDFPDRKYDEDYFNVEVNETNNLVKLKNRSSAKINLNAQNSLDGNAVGKMNYDDSIYSLATKEFQQLVLNNDGETLPSVQSENTGSIQGQLYGTIGFLDVVNDELSKYSPKKTKLSASATSGSFFTATNKVSVEFQFDIDVDFIMTEDLGSGTTTYNAGILLVTDTPVIDNDGNSKTIFVIDSGLSSSASPYDTTISLVNTISIMATAEPGTKFTIEINNTITTGGVSQFSCVMDVNKFDLVATDKLGIPGTQAQWYQLHDTINKNLTFITSEYDFLYSEILGNQERGYDSNGCYSEMRITNGFRVRQIDDDKKAPILAFKDMIKNINAMDAVGYGIEELDSPIGLGIFQVQAQNIVANILTVIIPGDVTSSWDVGDFIGFFDSELLYGTWEITFIEYDSDFETTEIKIDVTGHSALYRAQNVTGNAYLTSNKTTALRERLRVEEWEHFYADIELIDLGVVQEYSEEPFNETIYNQLDIGFKTFSNDENKPTTLEEIHTDSSWSFPLAKTDNSLDLKLSWIGSTFLFNDSRAVIFSNKPTTSNILDNRVFFCETAEKEGTFIVDFDSVANDITMPADAYENVLGGVLDFSITGAATPGNNTDYVISGTIIFNIEDNTYIVPVTSVSATDAADSVFMVAISTGQKLVKPEADDFLTNSSGITRPSYFMNQRRTIKRFLIRWGKYINSFLYYVGNVTIQNLFYVNNGEFTSELDTYLSTDCLGGDNSYTPIVEEADVLSTSLATAKFKPNLISCTVKVCDSDYDMIVDAHKNALQSPDEAKNYGYFTATSPNGTVKTGWLMNLKRSPVNRIAKIQLLEKV